MSKTVRFAAILSSLFVMLAGVMYLTPAEFSSDTEPAASTSDAPRIAADFCVKRPWHRKCQTPTAPPTQPTPTEPTPTEPTPTEPTPTEPTPTEPTPTEPTPTEPTPTEPTPTEPTPTEPTPTEPTTEPGGGVCTAPTWTTTAEDTISFDVDPYDPPNGIGNYGQIMVASNWWAAGGYNFQQSLNVCDFDSWYSVTTTDNTAADGAVKAYPNTKVDYIDWGSGQMDPLANYSSLGLSWAHATSQGDGIWNWAWDVWLNGVGNAAGTTELMIWTENHNQRPAGDYVSTVTIEGQTWDFWITEDKEIPSFVATSPVRGGTLNLLAFTDWLTAHGHLRADSVLGQIGYGVELVSTNGQPVRFDVTDFWINEVPR